VRARAAAADFDASDGGFAGAGVVT
jgi:hypothetical protein